MCRSIGCCIMVAGVGFVAGAMLASNNAEVRKWFTSTTKKLNDMYDDLVQKINTSKVNSSNENSQNVENVSSNSENLNTKKNH